MLDKNHKSKNGFTIIEIMIVLAIAGLIMLIIFLAVPALQRSARNTQRKNDSSAIATAIANFIDNNGGQTPSGLGTGPTSSNLIVCAGAGNSETATLGYYAAGTAGTACAGAASQGNIYLNSVSSLTTPAAVTSGNGSSTTVSVNNVVIEVGENCNALGTGAGQLSTRSAAIFYGLESNGSGGVNVQCLEQ